MRRVFLGWETERRPLEVAAQVLLDELGSDLGDVVVAVPGRLAGRRLQAHLARRAPRGWTPPRVVTGGGLVDALVRLGQPSAGRLERTLLWARALRGLPRPALQRIVAEAPSDLAGWLRLAATVRTLHAELAVERVDFAAAGARVPAAGERARWEALAAAQADYRAELARLGRVDPHEGRAAALDEGGIDPTARVALVGVAELGRLQRDLLERLGERATAFVLAPEELAADFDACGAPRVERWAERALDLDLERWHVVPRPADQARRTVELLRRLPAGTGADAVTLGVPDPEVVPYLERHLAAAGVAARDAGGTPLARTAPARLLAAAARFLPARSAAAGAALARHPDVDAWLRARAPKVEPAAALDRLRREHLPARLLDDGPRQRARGAREVEAGLKALLGPLLEPDRRPLAQQAGEVRGLLQRLYGERELDGDVEEERVLGAALDELAAVLAELESLPGDLADEPAEAVEALELVLRAAAGRSVPPAPARRGVPTIELYGWLELPLDDAPALVVTGFQEGRVPEAPRADGFLPDGLRRELGLADERARTARDAYALQVLLATRTELHLVGGRRSAAGDPLLPSRLGLFATGPEDAVARVRHALAGSPDATPEDDDSDVGARADANALPRLARTPEVEVFSVTSFRLYLESPYRFYLERVLRLETVDDRLRELDPLAFGTFAHAVLQAFGKSDVRDATDARAIEAFLHGALAEEARERFGARPEPAVLLQLAQLERRFALFARAQAERAVQGWRIEHVEWQPGADGVVELRMAEGEPPARIKGKVDRIDYHAEKDEWAVLDYKTGDAVDDPEKTHRRGRAPKKEWIDLQLPLYRLLVRELVGDARLTLGYFALPKDAEGVGVRTASWGAAELDGALEAAREVVRAVRREELFTAGRGAPREPLVRALLGEGLIVAEDGPEAEEGAA